METYGHWTVLDVAPGKQMLLCRCICGVEKPIYKYNLKAGKSKSCGCMMPGPVKHGLHGTPEYSPWKAMKARCCNQKHKNYADYGGRGIRVCDRWFSDFPAFLADMGPRPSPAHSIERNDSSGDYEPGNCRWATQTEQTRNTRRSRTITIDGVTRTVAEWVERTGISQDRVYKRLAAGKTGRDALFAKPWSPEAYAAK